MSKIKVPVLFLITILLPVILFSQYIQNHKHRCGSQYVIENEYKKNPSLKSAVAKERARLMELSQQNATISFSK